MEPSLITSAPAWIVRYEDGYIKTYHEKKLKKILVHVRRKKVGHQIDHIFVSHRWKSCVTSCKVRWAPAIHRNTHGEKDDHGLLESVWKWRIRNVKQAPAKDFSKLTAVLKDENGKEICNETLEAFDEAVEETPTTSMQRPSTHL